MSLIRELSLEQLNSKLIAIVRWLDWLIVVLIESGLEEMKVSAVRFFKKSNLGAAIWLQKEKLTFLKIFVNLKLENMFRIKCSIKIMKPHNCNFLFVLTRVAYTEILIRANCILMSSRQAT